MAKDKNPGRKTSEWINEFTRLLLERIFVIDEYIVYVFIYVFIYLHQYRIN